MPLSAGEKLGPYEVISAIGAGGMGQVYKARDTRLNRDVAIKVLPEHIANREDLRARFEREARVIASLNHPHICVLFDIGSQDGAGYMVMEHIEGETVAQRIEKGALPLNQALKVAIDIADALDRAHRAGVIHRDVKPQNIMLTRDGVKVLDFGLAKSHAKPGPTETTLTAALTTEATVMGTPQYMAPEQFDGTESDARSDIWAFGAVLYEMVTGRKAFEGKSYSSLFRAILSADPPPMAVKPFTPAWLERLVFRCLEKDPDDRYQSMRDVCLDLRNPPVEPVRRAPGKPVLFVALAAALALGLAIGSLWLRRGPEQAQAVVRRFTLRDSNPGQPAISPDGRYVAYLNYGGDQTTAVVVHDFARGARNVIATAPRNFIDSPFWFPDGKSLGYRSRSTMRRALVEGGDVPTNCEVGAGFTQGRPAVHPDGSSIIFALGFPSRLYRCVLSHGVEELPYSKAAPPGVSLSHPLFVDGGTALIFVQRKDAAEPELVWMDGSTGRTEKIGFGVSPLLTRSGHLLFYRGNILWGMPVQGSPPRPRGEPFPVARDINFASVAGDGTLAYLRQTGGQERLIAKNRRGEKTAEFGQASAFLTGPRLSPDGRSVLVRAADESGANIWLHTEDGRMVRLTFEDSDRPAWLPDGQGFTFTNGRNGHLYQAALNGSKTQLLIDTPFAEFGYDWSPDGKLLAACRASYTQGCDLFIYRRNGPGKLEAFPVLESKFDESGPMFSPDGKFIAYSSDESGRSEVYVRQYPDGGKWQVSIAGGAQVHWRGDGKELFYVEDDKLMAVSVSTQPRFTAGKPEVLFRHPPLGRARGHQWDVSKDGQRFLVVDIVKETEKAIQIVQNWAAELKNSQ